MTLSGRGLGGKVSRSCLGTRWERVGALSRERFGERDGAVEGTFRGERFLVAGSAT